MLEYESSDDERWDADGPNFPIGSVESSDIKIYDRSQISLLVRLSNIVDASSDSDSD